MTTSISNSDDLIDSRDVIARIEELESELEDFTHDEDGNQNNASVEDFEDWEELESLRALADEASAAEDWWHGETLIRDSYFETYAQELAEDCGMIDKAAEWPARCIDWDQAARELQQDYICVDFDGVDYWIR